MGRSSRRFSYLLLEEGEFYLQDWIATCRPGIGSSSERAQLQPWQQRRLKGCLRLCSRSIFFEPDNINAPIIMFPFNKMKKIEGLSELPKSPSPSLTGKWTKKQEGFVLESSLHVKMKERGLDAPYVFEKQDSIWWFSLEFAPVQQFLMQTNSLYSINLLPQSERDMILSNTRAQQEAQAKFDTSRLVDLSEEILLNYPAAQVTPLIREPGRFVVTQTHLYFQPLHNLNNDSPVRLQALSTIIAAVRRRHSLRHIGLEIFFKEMGSVLKNVPGIVLDDGASVFFTFWSAKDRDTVVEKLLELLRGRSGSAAAVGSLLEADASWLQRVMRAWQERLISNFEYLIYLNLAAGRSFCDLTQWPVMPWIVKDYKSAILDLENPNTFRDLSKPIGALNADRLSLFQERHSQMLEAGSTDSPFLYGTHYSTPGYVLYWLVRVVPGHMLRLQNGRFDAPDRLFISVQESWESVLSNPADLKELIPEFFSPPADFLVMRDGLNLGVRQNGLPVGDVQLPPWAKSSDEFVEKNRQALESEYVSSNLHSWIDLIFGFKQRGEAALEADNLFHPLTYEGTVDLDQIDDPAQRAGLEVQINEFGQIPRQLFTHAHPIRLAEQSKVATSCKGELRNIIHGEGFRVSNTNFLLRLIEVASSESVSDITEVGSSSYPTKGDKDGASETSPRKSYTMPRLENTTAQEPQMKSPLVQNEESVDSDFKCNTEDEIRQEPELQRLMCSSSRLGRTISDSWSPASISGLENDWKMNWDAVHLADQPDFSLLLARRLDLGTTKNKFQNPRNEEEELEVSTTVCSKYKSSDVRHPWHWMFRQRLSEPYSLKLHRGPVYAVVLSEDNATESLTSFSVGQDAFIKVYSISEGFQIRATKLGNLPLCSLALASSTDAYPMVFAGSYDSCLYAYSIDYDRALGKIHVHEETVSCVKVLEHNVERLITASWDATVKSWNIDEGRGGWMSSSLSTTYNKTGQKSMTKPEVEFLEHESAVLSLDVEQYGYLVVSGAADGSIIAWDMRTPSSSIWKQCNIVKGPVTGIRLLSDNTKLAASSEDGSVYLLEAKQGGALLETTDCKTALKCCELAGEVVLAGSLDGSLHFWPLVATESTQYLDFSPIHDHTKTINSISLVDYANGTAATLATASDDGLIQLYKVGH